MVKYIHKTKEVKNHEKLGKHELRGIQHIRQQRILSSNRTIQIQILRQKGSTKLRSNRKNGRRLQNHGCTRLPNLEKPTVRGDNPLLLITLQARNSITDMLGNLQRMKRTSIIVKGSNTIQGIIRSTPMHHTVSLTNGNGKGTHSNCVIILQHKRTKTRLTITNRINIFNHFLLPPYHHQQSQHETYNRLQIRTQELHQIQHHKEPKLNHEQNQKNPNDHNKEQYVSQPDTSTINRRININLLTAYSSTPKNLSIFRGLHSLSSHNHNFLSKDLIR
nr:MAG TPA: hypothetical protein [Microviridae sp.]